MIRSRLAPTPSGFLHLGNAVSFVLTWLIVRKHGGRLHLRIDDLDRERVRPEYVQDVFDTLEWLGLNTDSGPLSTQDFEQNWSQHRRIGTYRQALEQLRASGHVFACGCSRTTPHHALPNGVYAGLCRDKGLPLESPPYAWRVRLPENCDVTFMDVIQGNISIDAASTIGDAIVRRNNGFPAYQIASLVDDCLDGITLIVRGADLLPSTALQLALAEMLGYEMFQKVQFRHHPLLTNSVGQKLSKSDGSYSLKALRSEKGNQKAAEVVFGETARILGLEDTFTTLSTLFHAFQMHQMHELSGITAPPSLSRS
jgi:glutamyl-Q tRNA(Asp) synthetase